MGGMDDNDFGDASNKCGTGAYNIITGKLNGDKFKSCLKKTVAIADSCADCYVTVAQYGASNCKAACLLGWCKQGCLDCTAPAQTDLATCTGFAAGSPKPCLKSTAGSCSADDQSKLSTMTSSTAASLRSCRLLLVALSAMPPTVSLPQRIARLPACLDGASRAASTAAQQLNQRQLWMHAPVSLQDLRTLAWRKLQCDESLIFFLYFCLSFLPFTNRPCTYQVCQSEVVRLSG